jgi:hypothetical protein
VIASFIQDLDFVASIGKPVTLGSSSRLWLARLLMLRMLFNVSLRFIGSTPASFCIVCSWKHVQLWKDIDRRTAAVIDKAIE